MRKMTRKDAEKIMLGLADMEDFIEVMIVLEDGMVDLPDDSVDYLVHLLQAIHGDDP
jgi:hypothetical protein